MYTVNYRHVNVYVFILHVNLYVKPGLSDFSSSSVGHASSSLVSTDCNLWFRTAKAFFRLLSASASDVPGKLKLKSYRF